MTDYYKLSENTIAKCDANIDFDLIKSLWRGFTFKKAEIELSKGDTLSFVIGNGELKTLSDEDEFIVSINNDGVGISAKDTASLMRGIISLMFNIDYSHRDTHTDFIIRCGAIKNQYKTKNRMIHLCIFPETETDFLRKVIRVAGLCQYTHIVIEFWGTFRFDTLNELSWNGYELDKETIKDLIKEIKAFGMEAVPMFNHLGHASQSRGRYGKHVVLDRNPALQYLFTPDGWCWDIQSEYVRDFLKKIRYELYEIFGDGEYFHLGCDEAYYIARNKDMRSKLPAYLKYITGEVVKEGRRPIIWLDMLLPKGEFKDCYGVSDREESIILLDSLAKETVGVDWQYDVVQAPVESLLYFKDKGIDIIGGSWFDNLNYRAHIDTIKDNNLFGFMLTTWHTLNEKFYNVMWCSSMLGANEFSWAKSSAHTMMASKLMRIVNFEDDDRYESFGWMKYQI